MKLQSSTGSSLVLSLSVTRTDVLLVQYTNKGIRIDNCRTFR
jgi:hypothetical protein